MSYYYLYDAFLAQRKYAAALAQLERRVTDLGIRGAIGRLTLLKNIPGLVEEGIRKGAKTIVVVGDDETVLKAFSVITDANRILGIIPFGASTAIADALGIPYGAAAAEILSERLTRRLDVGIVNEQHYFLRDCAATLSATSIECDARYRVAPRTRSMHVAVYNLPVAPALPRIPHPADGILDATITHHSWFKTRAHETSYLPVSQLSIPGEKHTVLTLDGWRNIDAPARIEVLPETLRVIIGKKRRF